MKVSIIEKNKISRHEKFQDKKEITIAITGIPNSGKTTIFNNITGARQHVGNYPGVTVEQKSGDLNFRGYRIKVIDLPGTYSLTAYSAEEVITRDYIIKQKPDAVINVVDASNPARNLYLTTQLIETDANLIIAFNMSDILQKEGIKIDMALLSQLLGASIVNTVGSKNIGTTELLEVALKSIREKNHKKKIRISYGDELENEITKISGYIENELKIPFKFDLRWLSVKLLEQDHSILDELKDIAGYDNYEKVIAFVDNSIRHIRNITGDEPVTLIAEARYGFVNGALKETMKKAPERKITLSDRVDSILLNRYLGLPIFALIMWAIFQLVFKLGDYPTRWLQIGFDKIGSLISAAMGPGLLQSLIVDGIIGGVGGVLVFTPKIMLLFISIAVLEDTGYMSRAAFIMDRIMHGIGLHGKSFVPMLIGFGCTVPAYMCGRTLENKNDRLITMHINTFMSCGGRLPIYILFAGTFFGRYAGNIIFSIYIIGILMAVAFAKILRMTRFKGESEPFVMELPVYRLPTFKGILMHMWERTWLYIKKAGTVILSISIIVWILFTFPQVTAAEKQAYLDRLAVAKQHYAEAGITRQQFNELESQINAELGTLKLEQSAAGRVGHFLEPVFKPLGFDWRLAVASVAGIAGKEVVVSTLGTIFSISDSDRASGKLMSAIKNTYSPLTGYNFMIFSLLYFPCIAGLAVFKREAGTKEMLFQAFFTLSLAWVVSFIVYQTGKLFL